MAKLDKATRDEIRLSGRKEREPFRPSSQNRFMEPNLEELYREEASAGKVVAQGVISHRICSPVDYDVRRREGI